MKKVKTMTDHPRWFAKPIKLKEAKEPKIKPIKPIAKPTKENASISKRWLRWRKQYLKDHPANFEGYRPCNLQISDMCPKMLLENEVTLDHIKKRSTHPELRFVEDNIQILCWPCHWKKDNVAKKGVGA